MKLILQKTFKSRLVLTLVLMVSFLCSYGQTNPTAQSIPYSESFSSLAASSTVYPAGIQGWQVSTSAGTAFKTNTPTGDKALVASSTASTNSGNVHNYNGKIGYLNSGSFDGSIVLALNTTGKTSIQVAYDVMTIRNPYDGAANTKISETTLQYRIGTTGAFTTLTGIEYQNNTTTQTTAVTTPQNLLNKVITLPSGCNNQAVVQVRWVSRDVSGGGARPSIAIDNIVVTSAPTSIIGTSGTPSSLTTEYGSASAPTSFDISGSGMVSGISVDPPTGFEVSTLNDFSSNVGTSGSPITIGFSGTISPTTIYLRLANGIAAGIYNGNVLLSSTGAANVFVAVNSTNTVIQKELTISGLTADDKVFDNNTTATLSGTASLVGVLTGDTANVSLGGTPVATFNDATVNTNKPVTVTGYTISGSASANYSLTQPTGLTANITSSGLLDQTITFGSLSSVTYGDVPFVLTATSDSSLTVSYTSSNTNVATVSGDVVTIAGAGITTITATQAGNGSYNPATPVAQTLVVNQKGLTISGASASNKEYDATTTASVTGGSLVGVVGSDDVTFSGNGVFDTANVGTAKVVTGALVLGGLQASNYSLTQPVLSADVTEKSVTITGISVSNKEYDTTTSATITGTASLVGVITSDLSNVSLGGSPIAVFDDATVGNTKNVTVSGYALSGSVAANYSLSQPSGFIANITLRSLTIVGLTADNKIYDRTANATLSGTASLSGILSGDESNISLDGTPTASFADFLVGNTKTVSVSGYSLSGSALANYTLSPLTLSANITKKDVTIDGATASDKFYDGTTTATLTGTLGGVITPDSVSLTLSGTFADANVGTNKPVTSTSSIGGADVSNYNLLQPSGLTASINAGVCGASTGLVTWNFNTATPSSNTVNGVVISALSQGNNNGTTTPLLSTTSASSFAGASAGNNAGAATFTGALNTASSTYFEFTVTPQAGYTVTITGATFGSRSTGTGPAAYTLRSSLDGYTANVATGSMVTTSTWTLYTTTVTSTTSLVGAPVTFRLYGHSGAGSPTPNTANWRIDDLKLNLTATPGPALSSATTATICSGDTFNYSATTNYTGATISWIRPAVAGISNAAVTVPQTANPSEVLENTTLLPVNVVYEYTVTTATCYLTQNVVVTVNPILTWYLDADNDGYYIGEGISQCDSPGVGYRNSGIIADGDCDDTKATTHPGAVDVCYDGIDNDCNGNIDNVGLPGGCTPINTVVQGTQCGTTLATIDQYVYANIVANAQGYRFKVTDLTTSQVQTIDKALRVFQLTQLGTYAFNRTYQVEVSVRINNVWQPYYGSPCTVTTPATTTSLQSAQCGSTLTAMGDVIYANNVPFAAGYRFRVVNLLTSQVQTIDRPIRDFRMTLLATAPEFNSTYTVEVAVKNTDGTYLPYGSSCNITTPSFPTTQLQTAQCDYTAVSASETFYADSNASASMYRFKFENTGLGYVYTIDRPTRSFVLSTVPGLLPATPYSVSVSIQIGGVFGPYGKICTLTTSGAARPVTVEATPERVITEFKATAYPNPFAENFKLDVNTSSEEVMQVRVYDMLGKLVEERQVKTTDLETLTVGDRYSSGVYNVIVTQGENTQTVRVIKR